MKIEDEDPEVIQLELKYCERCGALWLRLRGAQDVYCGPCDLEVLDLPSPRRVPSKPRLPGNHKIESRDATGKSVCVLGAGGNRMTVLPRLTPMEIGMGGADVVGDERQRCRRGARSGLRLHGSESALVPGRDPDLWLYRDRTLGLLRWYLQLSVEVGRLPSLLGREFFRTGVTSYRATTFEDAVIFVHDVARGRERLKGFENKLIARIVLQEYTQNETARLLGYGRRTVDGDFRKRWIS